MDNEATSPRLWAYALIGHEDRLLLIPNAELDVYLLPGTAVLSGEPVEHGLRRALYQQFATTVDDVDFYAAVEHGTHDHDRGSRSEVALLFDVTLTEPDHLTRPGRHVWVDDRELTALAVRPEAVKDCLLRAPLSSRTPWWAWTP